MWCNCISKLDAIGSQSDDLIACLVGLANLIPQVNDSIAECSNQQSSSSQHSTIVLAQRLHMAKTLFVA